eukprot:TRINITY_DN12504_c0_g2_i2.p1 TRINITY_DN12504_c0_g2~~TRINITY_DN12504_c0_g2_i2.p1  ORF type:complete len:359 (-),score=58.94 TRINITY_DN12504_c0_g2_i2:124-1200(-)
MFAAGANMKTVKGRRCKRSPKPLCVCRSARADGSYSQAKLMRMKKAELQDACEEHGLEGSGTKSAIVARLMDHFSQLETDESPDSEKREVYVAAQAAAPVAAPLRLPRVERKTADDLNLLISRVDTAIEAKSSELEKKRASDREQTQALMAELSSVKAEWQEERAKVVAMLNELTSAQKGMDQTHMDVEQLTQQQSDLQQAQEALQRMIKARDEEVNQLRSQLQAMREQQAEATVAQQQERLAMLALASSVAESAAATEQKSPHVPVLPERCQDVSPAIKKKESADVKSWPIDAPSVSSKKIGIYGMAMPALFAGALVSTANKTYTEYRDIVLPAKFHVVADVAVLSALMATVAAVCT